MRSRIPCLSILHRRLLDEVARRINAFAKVFIRQLHWTVRHNNAAQRQKPRWSRVLTPCSWFKSMTRLTVRHRSDEERFTIIFAVMYSPGPLNNSMPHETSSLMPVMPCFHTSQGFSDCLISFFKGLFRIMVRSSYCDVVLFILPSIGWSQLINGVFDSDGDRMAHRLWPGQEHRSIEHDECSVCAEVGKTRCLWQNKRCWLKGYWSLSEITRVADKSHKPKR